MCVLLDGGEFRTTAGGNRSVSRSIMNGSVLQKIVAEEESCCSKFLELECDVVVRVRIC